MNDHGRGTAEDHRRSVLISGASSGIGRATALHLSQRGWRVFACVRKQQDADSLTSEAQGRVETLQLDVAEETTITSAAQSVRHRLEGRGLDGLFNNAGMGATVPVEYSSQEMLRAIFQVNLFGQIAMIRALLPLIRQAKGRVINTCSVGDYLTPPFAGALAGSKAAFASMSAALRLELRGQGIHVCVIEPGSIMTPAVDKTLGEVEKSIAGFPESGRSLYGEAMRRMATAFGEMERSGSAPEVVARTVERALTDRNPRTRYQVGKNSMKLKMLAWLMPEKLLDLAVLKTFGLPTRFGAAVK